MDYTITVSDLEKECLRYICADVSEFLNSYAKSRAKFSKDEIIARNTAYCNENGIAIAIGEEAQVAQAYSLKVILSGEDRNKVEPKA